VVCDLDEDELYWRKRESDHEFIASIARAREEGSTGRGSTFGGSCEGIRN